jgi:mgtE-like transporter
METKFFGRTLRESLPVLTFCAFIGVVAGSLIQLKTEVLVSIPAYLMLIAPLNDLGNDLTCILSSRISTLLALGIVKPKFEVNEALRESLTALIVIAFFSSIYIAFLNVLLATSTGIELLFFPSFLAICLITVLILTVFVAIISISISFIAWKKGLDPDNVTIPIGTTLSDLLGVVCLLIAIRIISFLM